MANAFSKVKQIDLCPACGDSRHFFFTNKNNFDIWQCENCGMRRVYPLPESIDVYSENYFGGGDDGFGYVDYDANKEAMRDVLIKYLDIIKQHTNGRRLLDVGGATGYFANLARQYGFDAQGIELSKEAVAMGREKGYPIEEGVLSRIDLNAGSLDVITLLDVLEHLPDPNGDISKVREILVPGGIMILNFPDHGSVFARVLGKRWHQYVPPEHLNFFHNKSITLFLEKHGFEILLSTRIGKRFPLSYIMRIGSGWLKFAPLTYLANKINSYPKVSSVSIPLDL